MPDHERQNLTRMLEEYIKDDIAWKTAYEKADKEWKKTADEKLEIVGSVQGFGKVSLYILGFISALGVGIGIVYKLIQWIRS